VRRAWSIVRRPCGLLANCLMRSMTPGMTFPPGRWARQGLRAFGRRFARRLPACALPAPATPHRPPGTSSTPEARFRAPGVIRRAVAGTRGPPATRTAASAFVAVPATAAAVPLTARRHPWDTAETSFTN
jgi:hypothetical protein